MPLLGDMWYMYFAVVLIHVPLNMPTMLVLIHVPLNMPTMLVDAADPPTPLYVHGDGLLSWIVPGRHDAMSLDVSWCRLVDYCAGPPVLGFGVVITTSNRHPTLCLQPRQTLGRGQTPSGAPQPRVPLCCTWKHKHTCKGR